MTTNSPRSPFATHRQGSPQQLVTRHNAVLFYGVAAASLLEMGVSQHAPALAVAFTADPAFRAWVEDSWMPAKTDHARHARSYIETVWPEFDWSAACDAFSADYRRFAPGSRSNQGIARAALVCSVASAQAAMFYRGLGAAADDLELRRLLRGMAADEIAHFECFRECYENYRRRERLGVLASFRGVIACASRARDLDVQLAFKHLKGEHWYGGVPLQDLGYGEFIARVGRVVRRHLPLGPAQRLLFKPWLTARDLPEEGDSAATPAKPRVAADSQPVSLTNRRGQ